jgi:hypothetical protein
MQSAIDKRNYELKITNKARLVLPDINNEIGRVRSCAINGLSEDSIEELYIILSVIERNLEISQLLVKIRFLLFYRNENKNLRLFVNSLVLEQISYLQNK